jgi:protoporphyrinogen oxidase
MKDVLVIGAGPAGLTAAYESSKLGLGATVLEMDQQVGGLARTVTYRDFRFDIGGHRFFTKVPYVRQIWNDLLGDDFLLRSRLSRIYYRERFFDYPLKVTNALWNLGPLESCLVGLSYLRAKLAAHKQDRNFEEWVSHRFGTRLYHIFFKTYTEKVWGISCREISADWAAQRIRNLSFKKALLNAILGNGGSKNNRIIRTLVDEFHYPRLGPGMMWERCQQRLQAQGHEIIFKMPVARIRHRNGRVECVCGRSEGGDLIEFPANQVISTMPLRELINCLNPPPPQEVLRAASRLRYRDYLTVLLIVKRENIFRDNWLYIHSPEVKVCRIQNYKNWSRDMVSDPTKTSLGLEYFLWDQEEEWGWSDEQLINLGISECAQIGLIHPSDVEYGAVVRAKKAYPVYDQSYQKNLEIIRKYLQSFSNLQTIGRNGLHRYNNQDHSMLTGVYAARNIVGEKHDVWSVNVDKLYHEDGQPQDRLVPNFVQLDTDARSMGNEGSFPQM